MLVQELQNEACIVLYADITGAILDVALVPLIRVESLPGRFLRFILENVVVVRL